MSKSKRRNLYAGFNGRTDDLEIASALDMHRRKRQEEKAQAAGERVTLRTICAGCDQYASCQKRDNAWLCGPCRAPAPSGFR